MCGFTLRGKCGRCGPLSAYAPRRAFAATSPDDPAPMMQTLSAADAPVALEEIMPV
jgi:hypothetical protein